MKKYIVIIAMLGISICSHAQLAVVDAAAQISWVAQIGTALGQLESARQMMLKVEEVNKTIRTSKYIYKAFDNTKKDIIQCREYANTSSLPDKSRLILNEYLNANTLKISKCVSLMTGVLTSGKYNLSDQERLQYINEIASEMSTLSQNMKNVTAELCSASNTRKSYEKLIRH